MGDDACPLVIDIEDENERNEEIHGTLQLIYNCSTSIWNKMDSLLAVYYSFMQSNSYLNEHGIGKFLMHYDPDEELKDELEKENAADCNLLNFDDEFPSNIENEKEKTKQIHKILQCLYKIATSHSLKLNDLSIINHLFSWNHILEIVDLEFDEKCKESLQQIIGQNALNEIPKNEELIKKLKECQNEQNLTDDQYKWILAVIEFHKHPINDILYEIPQQNVQKNEFVEEMIDIYGVHTI